MCVVFKVIKCYKFINADLCEDTYWQDHHPRGGVF